MLTTEKLEAIATEMFDQYDQEDSSTGYTKQHAISFMVNTAYFTEARKNEGLARDLFRGMIHVYQLGKMEGRMQRR